MPVCETPSRDLSARCQQLGNLAVEALAQTGIGELRRLRVDAAGNTLTLTGAVRSYYHKQLAQETVRTATSGSTVENKVAVCG